MKRVILILVLVVVLSAGFVYLNSIRPSPTTSKTVSLDNTFNVSNIYVDYITYHATKPPFIINYSVYVASNTYQQELGYMNQTSLGDCNGKPRCLGMLFIFKNDSQECFWMKNTIIPLKQIWIADNGHINLVYNATPYSRESICGTGKAVLETSINSTINASDIITT